MYGRTWRKARLVFLAANPLCVACEAIGRITAATDVDHKEAHRGSWSKFWDEGNWQALCHPHHSSKTAKEDGAFGNKKKQA
jgi:5-methylcytosine-specific restriction protein A